LTFSARFGFLYDLLMLNAAALRISLLLIGVGLSLPTSTG
jgi:hypothetical protein